MLTYALGIALILAGATVGNATVNLVPAAPCTSPNYWCTWSAQGIASQQQKAEDHARRDGPLSDPTSLERHAMDEKMLFEDPGVADHGFEAVRGELWFVVDDGWDVPYQTPKSIQIDGNTLDNPAFGRIEPDPGKFPSCRGTPTERLKCLNEKLQALGWRGIGLWIACSPPGNPVYNEAAWKAFYRQRLQSCHEAGVGLWKVDWGARSSDLGFRKMLTDLAHEVAPGLIIENCVSQGPFFTRSNEEEGGRALLAFSDLFRTYDVVMPAATTAARCEMLLQSPQGRGQGLLNVEGELAIAAGLGCTVAVTQHPIWDVQIERDLTRLIHWDRCAPPYGAGLNGVIASDHVNIDHRAVTTALPDWIALPARACHALSADGHDLTQSAPAVLARGLPLPEVRCEGEWPFVFANRNPNGCLAIATEARELANAGRVWPQADITIQADAGNRPIGVFGVYRSLTLVLNQPLGARRIWAQDLAEKQAVDLTGLAKIFGNRISLSGQILSRISTSKPDGTGQKAIGLIMVLR
jgi:hypothetical protein